MLKNKKPKNKKHNKLPGCGIDAVIQRLLGNGENPVEEICLCKSFQTADGDTPT